MATRSITVETDVRLERVDITDRIASVLPDEADGTATIFAEHTTCGVAVNEAERRLLEDVGSFLDGLVDDTGWAHDELDGNADAHLRASLFGPSVTGPVAEGEPVLGTGQSVLLVECDGPRRRSLSVTTE